MFSFIFIFIKPLNTLLIEFILSIYYMVCVPSCILSTIFIIGMIYFYNRTEQSSIVKHYKASLSSDLQNRYANISKQRMNISYQGYALGVVLSLGIIFYNTRIKHFKMNTPSLVCTVIATSFITNYFYHILSPKSSWMLQYTGTQEEVKSWLLMYREMQFNYHMGLVLGILAVGVLAFAFRC